MAYFSNGCEGDSYTTAHCNRCVHGANGKSCPVMLLHWLHNYDDGVAREMLDTLIPRTDDGGNDQCGMFVDAGTEVRP